MTEPAPQPATPLPWQVVSTPHRDSGRKFIVWGPDGPGHGIVCHTTPYGMPCTEEYRQKREADAAYIVHACNTLPKLAALVHRPEEAVYVSERLFQLARELKETK